MKLRVESSGACSRIGRPRFLRLRGGQLGITHLRSSFDYRLMVFASA
jgi:hypothetical protein